MSRQVSPSCAQVYGLLRVTRLGGVSRAALYRHRRPPRWLSVSARPARGHGG
jgi:hypothetical protein